MAIRWIVPQEFYDDISNLSSGYVWSSSLRAVVGRLHAFEISAYQSDTYALSIRALARALFQDGVAGIKIRNRLGREQQKAKHTNGKARALHLHAP